MNSFKTWAVDTAVRALKTASQSLAALLGANAFSVVHVDWKGDLAVAAGAAVACVLHNINTMPLGDQATAAVGEGVMLSPASLDAGVGATSDPTQLSIVAPPAPPADPAAAPPATPAP